MSRPYATLAEPGTPEAVEADLAHQADGLGPLVLHHGDHAVRMVPAPEDPGTVDPRHAAAGWIAYRPHPSDSFGFAVVRHTCGDHLPWSDRVAIDAHRCPAYRTEALTLF